MKCMRGRRFKAKKKKERILQLEEGRFFFIYYSSMIDINTYRQEKETELLNSYCETERVMDSVCTTVVLPLSNLPLALRRLFRTELGVLIS